MDKLSLLHNESFSVYDAQSLASAASCNAEMLDHLLCIATEDSSKEAQRAAWALTHLPKERTVLLEPYRNRLSTSALNTDSSTLRRLMLTLLIRLPWGIDDIETHLLDFCFSHINNPHQPYGVRALCIKLAWLQCRHYEELRHELQQSILMINTNDVGPGIQSVVKHINKALLVAAR